MLHEATPDLLERAVETTRSGIVIADATRPDLPLTYVNPAFEALTGYRAEECVGRNCRFLQGQGTDPAIVAELGSAIARGQDIRVVLLNYQKDGTPFFNELRLSAVRDASGRVVQVIGVQHDVSGLVSAQRTLELDRDRALAELRTFREALTPAELPVRAHLDLAAACVPAEQGVGGDFHLVAPGPGNSTMLAVGDAMGHGLPAARRATFVRSSLASCARFTDDPRRLLDMANRSLVERAGTSTEFVTAVCVTYDPDRRRLRWASAGHPVPLRLDDGAPIGASRHTGVPLGVVKDLGGSFGVVRMPPGSGVLLFTDGVPEARPSMPLRGAALRLGERRVQELLVELSGRPPAQVVEAFEAMLHDHCDAAGVDDFCLLAARTRDSAEGGPAANVPGRLGLPVRLRGFSRWA